MLIYSVLCQLSLLLSLGREMSSKLPGLAVGEGLVLRLDGGMCAVCSAHTSGCSPVKPVCVVEYHSVVVNAFSFAVMMMVMVLMVVVVVVLVVVVMVI